MGSVSSEKGGLKMSPHEGEKESPKTMTSDVHMKPTPSTGSTGLFTSGYASRYPDPFERVNGSLSLGSHVNGNASAMETARRDDVQTTPMFRISGMFTDFGHVSLIRSVRPREQRTVQKSDGIGSPMKRRAQIGFPTTGGHDLSHDVQIGRCVEGQGTEAGGNREVGSSIVPTNELHPLFGFMVLLGTLAKLLELRGRETTGFFSNGFFNYNGSMGLPAVFYLWSGSGRALRSVLIYEVKRPKGQIRPRKDVMPAVQGNAVGADGSGQIRLLCFCPYWAVIVFVG